MYPFCNVKTEIWTYNPSIYYYAFCFTMGPWLSTLWCIVRYHGYQHYYVVCDSALLWLCYIMCYHGYQYYYLVFIWILNICIFFKSIMNPPFVMAMVTGYICMGHPWGPIHFRTLTYIFHLSLSRINDQSQRCWRCCWWCCCWWDRHTLMLRLCSSTTCLFSNINVSIALYDFHFPLT